MELPPANDDCPHPAEAVQYQPYLNFQPGYGVWHCRRCDRYWMDVSPHASTPREVVIDPDGWTNPFTGQKTTR